MSAQQFDAAERQADEVWGEAEPGSQLETLAAAIRDLAQAARPLIEALDSVREQLDALRERVARVEEIAHDH